MERESNMKRVRVILVVCPNPNKSNKRFTKSFGNRFFMQGFIYYTFHPIDPNKKT